MPERITTGKVHLLLRRNLGNRPDLGLRKAVAGGVLEPANPFEPEAARPPRRWFVMFCLLAILTIGCLVYFNYFAAMWTDRDSQQLGHAQQNKAAQ